jgi:hypothetical protein
MFVCRRCAGVDYYKSQQTGGALVTVENRLSRIRRKLGATDGATNERPPDKPKYMHWRTYSRLAAEYLELQRESEALWLADLVRYVGLETLGLETP